MGVVEGQQPNGWMVQITEHERSDNNNQMLILNSERSVGI